MDAFSGVFSLFACSIDLVSNSLHYYSSEESPSSQNTLFTKDVDFFDFICLVEGVDKKLGESILAWFSYSFSYFWVFSYSEEDIMISNK